MRFWIVPSLVLISLSPFSVFAEDTESVNAEALQKTQALLANPAARAEAMKGDPKAQKADQAMKQLGLSPESQERMYRLSGQLLETMVKQTGGDSTQMLERMQAYQRDPASLEKDLTPEQRKAIERLSLELPGAQAPKKP